MPVPYEEVARQEYRGAHNFTAVPASGFFGTDKSIIGWVFAVPQTEGSMRMRYVWMALDLTVSTDPQGTPREARTQLRSYTQFRSEEKHQKEDQ